MLFRTSLRLIALAIMAASSLTYSQQSVQAESAQDLTFVLIVEGDDGQILGHEVLPGDIAQFATTMKRDDGAIIVTEIKDPAVQAEIQEAVNKILKDHGLSPMNLETLLKDRHVSCHMALDHHPSDGVGFAGPALFNCVDGFVVGTTALSPDRPIWKQRGLLLSNKEYPDRIHLVPIPPAPRPLPQAAAIQPAELTWEQASPYLSSIVVPGDVMTENGLEPGLKNCVGNVKPDSELSSPELIHAARRAIERFTNEDPGANPRLIMQHTKDGRFVAGELAPAIQHHLLELMREELAQQSSQLSSAVKTSGN